MSVSQYRMDYNLFNAISQARTLFRVYIRKGRNENYASLYSFPHYLIVIWRWDFNQIPSIVYCINSQLYDIIFNELERLGCASFREENFTPEMASVL